MITFSPIDDGFSNRKSYFMGAGEPVRILKVLKNGLYWIYVLGMQKKVPKRHLSFTEEE